MPSIPLHIKPQDPIQPLSNPLPELLHTLSGLAIIEIQGTINLPSIDPSNASPDTSITPVGRIEFPDYSPDDTTGSTAWMKRVHLYVGLHQRLTGEVKKLPNPIAVIRKRETQRESSDTDEGEELEIAEIVYWKLLFSNRPEPVGSEDSAEP